MTNRNTQTNTETTKEIFNLNLLNAYRDLLLTTNLQEAYQEFIRLFRYLRSTLERQLPDYRFQSSISENAMEYAYFSFTNSMLKEMRLKLSVVFVHKTFQLEVWLSGVNRTIQCIWTEHEGTIKCSLPMEAAADPSHCDYIVRLPVQADLSQGDAVTASVREAIEKMIQFLDFNKPFF